MSQCRRCGNKVLEIQKPVQCIYCGLNSMFFIDCSKPKGEKITVNYFWDSEGKYVSFSEEEYGKL